MSFNPNEARVPAGQAGGGRWGGGGSGSQSNAPRNAAAARAQQNPKAAPMFDKLVSSSPAERIKYLQGLSDSDLELLTEAVYSARTSDPTIVQSRIAVANEMSKRGLDIKKYGALGGGTPARKPARAARRKVTPAQHAAIARVQAGRAAAAAATKPPTASAPGKRAI